MIGSFHLCRPIRRFYKTILVGTVVLTGLGAYLSSKLNIDTDLAELLPDTFTSVRAAERIEGEVGGVSQLRVALRSTDFEAVVRFADALAEALVESEYVGSVDYENDVEFYETNALLFLEVASLDSLYDAVETRIDEGRQALNPFMIDDLFADPVDETDSGGDDLARWEEEYEGEQPGRYYLNPDSTVLIMSLNASRNASLGFSRDMVADVRERIAVVDPQRFAPDMEVFYGSGIKNRVDEFDAITSDIVGTLGYGVGGVFLLLIVIFRGLIPPILITVSLFASLTWTFGMTYLLIGQLNIITGFLFVVLFGMGADYGIHAMARYKESRQAGVDPEGAMHRMVCNTGAALLTTAVTTSAAFFSLMLLDFRGFSELGLITGFGMLFAFVAMVVVLPALVIMCERLGLLKVKQVPGKALTSERRPLPLVKPILVGSAVLTAASIFLFSRVDFQYDFTNLRIVTEERAQYSQVSTGVFTRSESPAMVLTDSRDEVVEVVAWVENLIATDTDSPTVGSVRSILSVLPADQEVKLETIRRLRTLVEEEAEGVLDGEDQRRVDRLQELLVVDEPFAWEEFPEKDRARFTNREGEPGDFVLIYPNVALRDGRNAIDFRDDIGTIVTESGKEFNAASSNLITADMLSMITSEGPIALGLALVVVFLAVLAYFRSLRAAVLVVTPVFIGILWMGGAMYVLGMQFNFFNVVVFPSIVGIGVDDGVHIYHRYKEEGPGSLPFVLRRTGMAIGMTTATTIVGYSGLILAQHPGLKSIGLLAVIGLVATFITAVVLLPAMLEFFEPRTVEAEQV